MTLETPNKDKTGKPATSPSATGDAPISVSNFTAPQVPENSASHHSPHDAPGEHEIIQPADFVPLTKPQQIKKFQWRTIHSVLLMSISLLGSFVFFLLTAASLSIHVSPLETQIEIDAWPKLKIGDNYLLWPGETTITLTHPGYFLQSHDIQISRNDSQPLTFTLEKLPGNLLVDVSGAIGTVWIDGESAGSLNQLISDIPAGEHQLSVQSERYLPYAQTINIEGMGNSQTLAIELQPAWANIAISSNPAGASVSADDTGLGVTPMTAEIIQGEREVSVSLAGYKTWREFIEVQAGQDVVLDTINLEKADGLMSIESQPSKASITVNGNYYGLTPQEISLAPGKTYQVTLFKEGYQAAHERAMVESGIAKKLNVVLEPNLGKISIKAIPEDALVYVEGRLMGRANQTITLPSVQTKIVVKKEGYADHSTTVIPRSNLAQTVAVTLKTLEEARWENIPLMITTAAGQRLKLFKVEDTFSMGSSRREQGRRANEGLRTATLDRAFYLGTHEITNAEFHAFAPEHSSSHVKGNSLNSDSYPVVNITWEQAARYCNWLSAQDKLPPFYQMENEKIIGFNSQSTGYRLLTEAEWAWAARRSKDTMLKFPWGEQLPPPENAGNFADRSAAPVAGYILNTYNDGFIASAPVGKFPANDKGIYDLAGNVSEWVHDFYDVSSGLSMQTLINPLGPTEGIYHVIRGSSWAQGSITELRLSFRDYGKDPRNDVGFRIARYVD